MDELLDTTMIGLVYLAIVVYWSWIMGAVMALFMDSLDIHEDGFWIITLAGFTLMGLVGIVLGLAYLLGTLVTY